RNVREFRNTRGTGDAERFQPPFLDQRERVSQVVEHEIDVPGQKIGDSRRESLIGHMGGLNMRGRLQHFAGEVRWRADAGRGVSELARMRLCKFNQVLQASRLELR